jgi:hypothetical protein
MLKQEAMAAKVQAEALEQQAETIIVQVHAEEAQEELPRDFRLEEEPAEGTVLDSPWPED